MDPIIPAELVELLIAGFPMLTGIAVGWLLAERRARQYFGALQSAHRRNRAILLEVANMQPETVLNDDEA